MSNISQNWEGSSRPAKMANLDSISRISQASPGSQLANFSLCCPAFSINRENEQLISGLQIFNF